MKKKVGQLIALLAIGTTVLIYGMFWELRFLYLLQDNLMVRDNRVLEAGSLSYGHKDFICTAENAWRLYKADPDRYCLVGRSVAYFMYLGRCQQEAFVLLIAGFACIAGTIYWNYKIQPNTAMTHSDG